ncbi:hypothetical protein HPB49_026617 [Dermacentor silvarum]|nr:hypothetical protein HPB49_026617 [Dermacentor silvarum]
MSGSSATFDAGAADRCSGGYVGSAWTKTRSGGGRRWRRGRSPADGAAAHDVVLHPWRGRRRLVAALLALCAPRSCLGNPDAKRLYDDLMSSYNRLIRPVSNNSDRLTVRMGLKLSQLIDVVRFATCAAPIRRLRDVHRRHDEREERTPRKPSSVARTPLGLKKWTRIRCPCPIHVSLPVVSLCALAPPLSPGPVRATRNKVTRFRIRKLMHCSARKERNDATPEKKKHETDAHKCSRSSLLPFMAAFLTLTVPCGQVYHHHVLAVTLACRTLSPK